MNRDARTLLSLVAAGRMSSAEAERWMAANREERLAKSESRWIFGTAAVAVVVQFWPVVVSVSQHLPRALAHLQHTISFFSVGLW